MSFAYLVGSFRILSGRRHRARVPISLAVIVLDVASVVAATTVVILGQIDAYQWTIFLIVAQPMLAFLLFLSTT